MIPAGSTLTSSSYKIGECHDKVKCIAVTNSAGTVAVLGVDVDRNDICHSSPVNGPGRSSDHQILIEFHKPIINYTKKNSSLTSLIRNM